VKHGKKEEENYGITWAIAREEVSLLRAITTAEKFSSRLKGGVRVVARD